MLADTAMVKTINAHQSTVNYILSTLEMNEKMNEVNE